MSTTIKPALGAGVVPVQEGVGHEPGYTAMDLRRLATFGIPQSGVRNSESFKVKERGAGANMSVDVGMLAGAAIAGTTVTQQFFYVVPPHKETLNEVVAAAHETNPRIDQVILRVYDNAIDGSGKNEAVLEVLKGTPEAGATLANHLGAAALPATSLRLAYVLVPAKATTILAANVEDARTWAAGGGLVSAGSELESRVGVGVWTPLALGAKMEQAAGFQPQGVRSEAGGAVARLRGALKPKPGEELKIGETAFIVPAGLRPATKVMFEVSPLGFETPFACEISAAGVATLNHAISAIGGTFGIDGFTYNLT